MTTLIEDHAKFIGTIKNDSSAVQDIDWFWNSRITYTGEAKGKNNWQSPAETLRLGTGDCEDIAVGKFKDLDDRGMKPMMIYALIKPSQIYHMLCWCNGFFLDIQEMPFIEIYRFDKTTVYLNNGQTRTVESLLPQWAKIAKEMESRNG